jgi:hypothetical protein
LPGKPGWVPWQHLGWLTETTPYLLLAAPAGHGKSALLVVLDGLDEAAELAGLANIGWSTRLGW